jgi:YggT family protein
MQSPIQFLLVTLFDLYVMVVLLRFMLQLFRADFYNPVSQFVVTVTNPLLVPMRKVIPGVGGIDVSSLLLAFLVVLVKIFLLVALSGQSAGVGVVFAFGLLDLLTQAVNLIFWLVLIRAIMSWINPHLDNPFIMVIYQVTEPIMAPVRKIIPPIGGLDLSPVVLIIGLQFLLVLVKSWY